jgi:energy-coupling factor transporter ATP-binding protein EcfA2
MDGNDDNDIPLTLSKASFHIGDAPLSDATTTEGKDLSGFTVSEFSFAKGEVLAVCGQVGSGKFTLLNGILDEEAEALGGEASVTKHGRFTYVPQTLFILNQMVQNNVLFGLPFDWERYEKVLDACCLRPDRLRNGKTRRRQCVVCDCHVPANCWSAMAVS